MIPQNQTMYERLYTKYCDVCCDCLDTPTAPLMCDDYASMYSAYLMTINRLQKEKVSTPLMCDEYKALYLEYLTIVDDLLSESIAVDPEPPLMCDEYEECYTSYLEVCAKYGVDCQAPTK